MATQKQRKVIIYTPIKNDGVVVQRSPRRRYFANAGI
jgi:hypothetical protein